MQDIAFFSVCNAFYDIFTRAFTQSKILTWFLARPMSLGFQAVCGQ